MRDMMEANFICNLGNRFGGLQQQPFGLFEPVILKIGYWSHSVHFQHHLSQIIGVIVQLLLQHRVRDIAGIVLTDEQFDPFGELNRGGVRGGSEIAIQMLHK